MNIIPKECEELLGLRLHGKGPQKDQITNPGNENLYISIIVKPRLKIKSITILSMVASHLSQVWFQIRSSAIINLGQTVSGGSFPDTQSLKGKNW